MDSDSIQDVLTIVAVIAAYQFLGIDKMVSQMTKPDSGSDSGS